MAVVCAGVNVCPSTRPSGACHPQAMYTFAVDVFNFLSFGYRVETVHTHYKRRTNITTYTTLYYISVLLVSVV